VSGELEVLSEDECLALLASNELGRVGVVLDGRPLILPVNYALVDRYVVIHSDLGSKLTGASLRSVAFEIDGFDAATRSGWSVLVQGMGHDLTDAIDHTSEQLKSVQVSPWAPGPKPRLLRIEATEVSGRRFHGGGPSPAS
jgi:nitroimidazol reductase NimA-like FMN-containing flavoprotein (pyridoxamine 5'-phosphate oxidase superfamily)